MVSKNQNPIWHEITDPNGVDKATFEASEEIYYKLFSSEHCEEWHHFRDYILDSQKRRQKSPYADPLDYYLVGSLGPNIMGMALLTTYGKKAFSFS